MVVAHLLAFQGPSPLIMSLMPHAPPEICGLVLAGGRSRRMGQDKSLLAYHGRPQVEACYDLLRERLTDVYISNRADQSKLPGHAGKPQLHDRYPDLGPMGGLLTAFNTRPDRAWLVVACDLPFLDRATLAHLLDHRDPSRPATAFRGEHNDLPEPMCAIYEPSLGARLGEFQAAGINCPRKILLAAHALLLELPHPDALLNANSPEEREEAQRNLRPDQQTHSH
jgi:molybdopterin-guanine dinucleotide biosynthesis protein A